VKIRADLFLKVSLHVMAICVANAVRRKDFKMMGANWLVLNLTFLGKASNSIEMKKKAYF